MSYAEAAQAGANLPNEDSNVPIKNNHVSVDESNDAQDNVDEERKWSTKIARFWQRVLGTAEDLADDAKAEIQDVDRAVATHATLSTVVASGLISGLVYQHKINKLNWWPVGASYAAVAVLFGGMEVWSIQKLKKEKRL